MSVWTDWDPLEEMIVGRGHEPGSLDWCIPPILQNDFNVLLEETNQDLDKLSQLLEDLNVTVHRPTVCKHNDSIDLGAFKINIPTAPVVPRDQYLVYGDTIYQTYTSMGDRYFDGFGFYDIFRTLFADGHNWLSQPAPVLYNMKDSHAWLDKRSNLGQQVYKRIYKEKLLWHTATMFKCGDKLITNTQGPGTQLGLEWMRRNLSADTIVQNDNTAVENWGHIDHGFFMTDDHTVFCVDKTFVPKCLLDKKIYSFGHLINPVDNVVHPELNALLDDVKGYEQVVLFYSNVIVVDSKNVIFNECNPEIVEFFKQHGITCHICTFKHTAFWAASLHCLTLDIKRRGEKRKIVNEV